MPPRKPPLHLQVTTLWDYPSQNYGPGRQGDQNYRGATPSYVIWNLLKRYTSEGDLVVDPMAGSGTTIDVAYDLGRRALGYDVNPTREEITWADARTLPVGDASVDFVFIDPPYATHLDYSDDPRCIGQLSGGAYLAAMDSVIAEIHRILRPGRHMALYVSDSFSKGKPFQALGFELFALLRQRFEPVDWVAVVRHNRTLQMGNYRKAAEEGNFFLRGFNHLLIMRKGNAGSAMPAWEERRAQHPREQEREGGRGRRGKKGKGRRSDGAPRRKVPHDRSNGGNPHKRPREG